MITSNDIRAAVLSELAARGLKTSGIPGIDSRTLRRRLGASVSDAGAIRYLDRLASKLDMPVSEIFRKAESINIRRESNAISD